MRVWGIIGVAAAGVIGAAALYACDSSNRAPMASAVDAPLCDSCSARKKDLSRMREALSAPSRDGSE